MTAVPVAGSPGRHRGLVGLLAAVGVSQLGTRMSLLAVPWFVLSQTGSSTATGAIAFAELAPYVAAQALTGPVLDRVPARWAAVGCDLGAAVAVAAVPVLQAGGWLSLPVLAMLLAAAGALRGTGDTARDVLVPGVAAAGSTPLERAAGLYDGVGRLASLVGAPLAGGLIEFSSATTVLGIDAASFAVSAIVVAATVRGGSRVAPPAPRTGNEPSEVGYLRSLGTGIRYLLGDRLLLGIATMVPVTNTLDQAYGAVLSPVWATDRARSPLALGLIGGAFALGAVLGSLAVAALGARTPRRLGYGLGFLLAGAPRFVALSLATTVSPVLPVALAAGLGAGGINPILGAVEYERIPAPLRARVLGTIGATAWAGMPFGGLAAGALVTGLGLRPTLWLAGAIYLAATLSPFVFPAWRGMERAHPPAPDPRAIPPASSRS